MELMEEGEKTEGESAYVVSEGQRRDLTRRPHGGRGRNQKGLVKKEIIAEDSFGVKYIYYSKTGGHVLTLFFSTCQELAWIRRADSEILPIPHRGEIC